MKKKRYLSNGEGVTLTEILVVVAIISLLSVLVTGYLRTQVFKGNDARRKADLNRIGIALEEYEKDNGCYPLPNLVVCNPGIGLQPYLDKIPCDPINKSTYLYEHQDSSCPKWYRIYSNLENENDKNYTANIGPNSSFSYYQESANAPAIVLSSPAPIPSQGAPTPTPSGTAIPSVEYFGCFNGVCDPISWDPTRPGPICDPSFQNSSCYGQCVNPLNECQIWN